MEKHYTLIVRGDTKPAKEVLKKAGYSWDADRQVWSQTLVEAHAARVLAGDTEFSHGSLKINRKGCQATLSDGATVQIVFTSSTWVDLGTQKNQRQRGSIAAGDPYQHDAAGNRVRGIAITGSAPDDLA